MLLLLPFAIAGVQTLPADLTGVELTNEKAATLVVQKGDGYTWPVKAPIRFAVEGVVLARVRLAAEPDVAMVVLRSGSGSWELLAGEWVEVELSGKSTITAAARDNARFKAGELRVELAPVAGSGSGGGRVSPSGAVVTLVAGAMPATIVASNAALSSSPSWGACMGFDIAGDPMITFDVPAGPGVKLTPDGQVFGVTYGDEQHCLVNGTLTVANTRVSVHPGLTGSVGTLEKPTRSVIAIEDLSVALAPEWSKLDVVSVDHRVLRVESGAQIGYLDLPLDAGPPLVAATGCGIKWESGFRKDNRKENPGSVRAGVQNGWMPKMELPGRYVLFTYTSRMNIDHHGPCLVGIQRGPWEGVVATDLSSDAEVVDRALASFDPFIVAALRIDGIGSSNRRRIVETAPPASWTTLAVDREGLTRGEPILPVERCRSGNRSLALTADADHLRQRSGAANRELRREDREGGVPYL